MNNLWTHISGFWKAFRSRKYLSLAFDVMVMAMILVLVYNWQTRNLISADGTQAIPQFAAETLDGQLITDKELHGKSHLVYFFATWCGICTMSMSNIVDLREKAAEEELGVYLVALNYNDVSEIREYAEEHQLNVPVILGTPRMAHDFKIQAFPTYYVTNKDGKIVSRDTGFSTSAGMRWRAGQL